MWGGLKKRTHYGDLFRRWSASRGLEELRIALYKEPRPWYLAYSLHQHNHLLQDHHCARLLAWCTSIVELQPSHTAKQEAYRYTQEMFQLLMRHHKAGGETLNEYMRLCAVGADLTSAFDWFKYWQEAQLDGWAALDTLTWLLQVARTTPSDERAEDMALTVMDLYTSRFATVQKDPQGGKRGSCSAAAETSSTPPPFLHYAPTSAKDVEALRRFFSTFKALEPRLRHNALLRSFLDTLPPSVAEAEANCAAFGWPVESPHRIFPQLEQHVHMCAYTHDDNSVLYASASPPRLRDSLLHDNYIAKVERSAERHNVTDVVALVEEYERRVTEERDKTNGERTPALRRRSVEGELWRRSADPGAVAYRRRLVEGGGIPPELYHYLITALATTQPTAALRTLEGMEAANLRPLDLTRAAVIVAVRDSTEDQRRLFQRQLDEIDARARLDADHDTHKVVESYWKFDYTEFFYHRNALSRVQFYLFLIARLGAQALQQLLLDTQVHGPLATAEDLVVLDDDLRHASRLFFRSRVGRGPVQAALDAVSHHMPKLDISLVGTLPHFENYFVEAADDIALSEGALQALVQPYDTIYVLDASFVETSESFLSVGGTSRSLVLIPYLSLAQLASSVSNSDTFTSFDPALQQSIRAEPFLASQRLRALFAMLTASSVRAASSTTQHGSGAESPARMLHRRARVLHFTECLVANQVEQEVLDSLHLSPSTDDNDQLLLVLAMLSCLKESTTRLVLCTDDTQLVERLEALQNSDLFGSAVEIVSTAPPANLDLEKDLVDDNPVWRDDRWRTAAGFEPRLDIAAALPPQDPSSADAMDQRRTGDIGSAQPRERQGGQDSPSAASAAQPLSQACANAEKDGVSSDVSEVMNSPWLALLEEQEGEGETQMKGAMRSGTAASPPSAAGASTQADASTAQPIASPLFASSSSVASTEREQEVRDEHMDLYETPFDVVPVGVRMAEASALGSVFAEFDSMDPEQRAAREADHAAARCRLAPGTGDEGGASGPSRRRRPSMLEREMLANRGFSNKDRFLMARRLSNRSGGRVPFNMRYRVVEANVRDPRNVHLRKVFQEGLNKKRAAFKRRQG
ncbi:hypothetical protein ABB37_03481 [Leptomonas pyrrhocoris]|uniref:Uncharacterized protein n=1 Tax=Leptomonas pyrrhocoris TaxID=157538 RepID=A0A0N0DWZ9_LEPPY|nr:hypothetical protein ABB37_03481 [Leptomonas pyrrhocoris]KPA82405.1 hypothetical protein ABB37_03481 [Leptomonas pyrrhocoris]|eukprot:XP_015660844.1 hypothetical protein ABB37_03481 [Leptomonas pyrrhocoris]